MAVHLAALRTTEVSASAGEPSGMAVREPENDDRTLQASFTCKTNVKCLLRRGTGCMQVNHLSVISCSPSPQMRNRCCQHRHQPQVRPLRHVSTTTSRTSIPLLSLTRTSVSAGLHGWRRAAAAVERETGLDVYAHQEFPQELGGLSKKFVTKIVTVIGETCGTPSLPITAASVAPPGDQAHKPACSYPYQA